MDNNGLGTTHKDITLQPIKIIPRIDIMTLPVSVSISLLFEYIRKTNMSASRPRIVERFSMNKLKTDNPFNRAITLSPLISAGICIPSRDIVLFSTNSRKLEISSSFMVYLNNISSLPRKHAKKGGGLLYPKKSHPLL